MATWVTFCANSHRRRLLKPFQWVANSLCRTSGSEPEYTSTQTVTESLWTSVAAQRECRTCIHPPSAAGLDAEKKTRHSFSCSPAAAAGGNTALCQNSVRPDSQSGSKHQIVAGLQLPRSAFPECRARTRFSSLVVAKAKRGHGGITSPAGVFSPRISVAYRQSRFAAHARCSSVGLRSRKHVQRHHFRNPQRTSTTGQTGTSSRFQTLRALPAGV